MKKKADPKSKLTARLFEKGLTAQFPSLERPRVFSLQKPTSTLTAKIVRAHRDNSKRNITEISDQPPFELPTVPTQGNTDYEDNEELHRSYKYRTKTETVEELQRPQSKKNSGMLT